MPAGPSKEKSAVPRHKRYSPEFKRKALEKLASGEYSLRRLAAELDLSVVTLLNWKRSGTVREDPPSTSIPASDEIARLRAEIEELKRERDRLRRGIALLVGVEIPD